MKNSTFSAQVANNLLTVLQGYSKTIRLLLVMFLTLTVSANVWGATYNFSNIPTSGWKTNGGSQTINGKSWTYSSATYVGCSDKAKIQIGSKNNPQTSNWTIQIPISSFGANIKVTKVAITAYTTATTATYGISVNGSSVKSGNLTTSSATYSSNTLNATTGSIVVTLKGSSNSKAMYLSDIAVTYETAAAATYKVTYNANGATSGTVPTDATSYTSGTTVTVKSNSGNLAKTGYTFGGWNTKSDGTGTNYTAGSGTFTITANTTLYAKWNTATKYTVTLNAGPGTCAASVTEASAGAGVTLPTPSLDCDGWTFAGWAAASVGAETTTKPTLTPAGAYSPTSNITLYAVYQRTEETEGNGGETEVTKSVSISTYATANNWSDATKYTSVTIDENITATASTGTNTGKYYNNGTNWRFYQNESPKLTISAATGCTIKTVKVTYSVSNTGVLTYNGANVSSGTATTINATSATFGVGNTGSATNGQVRITAIEVTYTTTSAGGTITTTYYHSTPDCGGTPELSTYSITIDNNIQNGTIVADKSSAAEGETVKLTVTPEAGYKLEAITVTKATGGIVEVENKTFTMPASNVTVSATFTEIPKYTVSFSTGTGNSTPADISETVGGAGITLPDGPTPDCSEEGWEFGGWSTTNIKDQTTTISELLSVGSNYKPTKNTTLYAVYSKTESAGNGGAQTTATLTNEEIAAKYVNEVTTKYGEHTIESESGIWGGMIVIGNLENTKYIQISSDKTTNRHLASPTFSANITNITIKGRHNASKTRNIYICSSNETAQPSSGDLGYGSIASSGVENQYTDWTDVSITVSGSHTKFYVYADGGLQIHSIIVTIGGSTTTTYYHSNPCEVATTPTWEPARIDHNTIQVACGSKTQLGAAAPNGPATITFSGYDLQNSVTVTASEGFLVSTNKEKADTYQPEVIVNPHKDGNNIGKIQNVYVIAQAPAQSGDFTGTITLTGADITGGSQVINVTADVTCTTYTITWSVNGDDSHQVTYSPGDALQLPSISVTPCDGMDHVGWTDNMGYVHRTDILFTETTDMTVTGNQTYYAVFATLTSSGDGETTTTLDFSQQGYANQEKVTSVEKEGIFTVSFSQGEASDPPAYYNTGTAIRVYAKGSFTVSSTKTISQIEITFGTGDGTNEISTNVGDYSDGTWNGSANEIIFTVGGDSKHRRIKSIAVTSAGGGASYYTDYTTTCEGRQLETPTNLQATDITYKSATLTWDAVAGANKYKVVINGTEYISNTNSYTTHDLKQQTAYTWTVQAIGNGTTFTDSEISAEATFTTGAELIITWSVSTATSTTTITKGQPIGANLKTPATPAGCEGKVFMGWTESSTVNSDGSGITYITSATEPEANVTYYAVFAEPAGNGGAQGELFSESFDTMDGKGGNDGEWSGNIAAAQLNSFDDWTLSSVYKANACIKLGTGSLAGSATTPALGINGNATLTFDAGAWNGGSEKLIINLTIVGDGSIEPSSVTLTKGQFNTYTANITGANADTKVQFIAANAANNRFFLDEVKVSGGSGNTNYTDYSTSCGMFTITYYGFNSGGYTTTCNDNPAVDEVEQGGTYVIPNCEPAYDPQGLGRTFAGTWNTKANGKGTAYEPGDEIANVSEDIILYAQWTLNTSENTTLPTDVEDLATTDIIVTGGTTLTLKAGKTTINSLTLKGGLLGDGKSGNYAMPSVWVPEGATLVRNNTTINLDLVVNSKSWYPFAVPFATTNDANVEYLDPTLAAASTYGTHFAIKTYDGARRAKEGVDQTNNWVQLKRNEKLQPGKGYIISARTYRDKDTATIRIPMSVPNEWLADGEQESITVKEQTTTRNKVTVYAHEGAAATEHKRHAGWNFVANPYLANFAGNNVANDVEYIKGSINIQDKYTYEDTEVTYVTVPAHDFSYYEQFKLSDATLSPAYSFFVQVGKSGTMTFETAGRQQAPASIAARAEERPVKMDVDITLSDNHSSDQTGIIISDRYNDTYEIGRDLEKLFGSAYNLSVYTLMADNTPLAFQALAIRSNMQVIPVGYRAPEQGEYTFRLNEATSSIDLLNEQYEQLVLVDYQTGELTNLLISDYTFYSERTQADNRFAIYAVPRQNTPTDLPNAIGQDKEAQKIIHNGHLYILRDGNVYNGNGQIVK